MNTNVIGVIFVLCITAVCVSSAISTPGAGVTSCIVGGILIFIMYWGWDWNFKNNSKKEKDETTEEETQTSKK